MSLKTPSSEPCQDTRSPLRRRMYQILGASTLFLSVGCQDASKAEPTSIAPTAEPTAAEKPEASASATPKRAEVKECLVKGNISSKGRKLYHVADDCPDYKNVKINRKGEQCFSTEAEALEAGWTKAGSCK